MDSVRDIAPTATLIGLLYSSSAAQVVNNTVQLAIATPTLLLHSIIVASGSS